MCKTKLKPPSVVVCAAIRKDGLIVAGARHFDGIMRNLIGRLPYDFTNWEQGFLDQYGNFLTRQQAWQIARAQNQIRRPTGLEHTFDQKAELEEHGVLFSENLY